MTVPHDPTVTGDYGGVVHLRPERHWRPSTAGEISAIIREAARRNRRVVVRGQGHTLNGQSQTDEWLLSTARLDSLAVPDPTGAWVGGGAVWRNVVRHCAAHGLCPPVLTDYLGPSVGGTVSAGGFGPASATRGLQVDHVLELEVVTAAGDVVRCSPDRDRELYNACRAGFGQFGVITAVRLRLDPAPRSVAAWESHPADPAAFVTRLADLAGTCDEVFGTAIPRLSNLRQDQESALAWEFVATGLRHIRPGAATTEWGTPTWHADHLAYTTRLDQVVDAVWSPEGPLHPWLDVLIPIEHAADYLRAVTQTVTPETLGAGSVLAYITTEDAGNGCFAARRRGGRHVRVDVLRTLPPRRPALLARALAENATLLRRAAALGGSLYAISAVDAAPAEWADATGPEPVPGVFVGLGERVMNMHPRGSRGQGIERTGS